MKRFVAVAAVIGLLSFASLANAQLGLQIRPDGNTWLVNEDTAAVPFDGYTISDASERLDEPAWRSIERAVLAGNVGDVIAAFGAGALAFGSANPNAGNLTELTLGAGGSLGPDGEWNFGPIIAAGNVDDDLSFTYSTGGGVETGNIEVIPEPSSLILCGLGLIGLLWVRRRK